MRLLNYRSIAACDVELESLNFLVGPNEAGKSNFLDSLCFVADALNTTLDQALRVRGGFRRVLRDADADAGSLVDGPLRVGVRVDFELPDGSPGHYAFLIGYRSEHARSYEVSVLDEECVVGEQGSEARGAWFRVSKGRVLDSSEPALPPPIEDRLLLVAASGVAAFRPVFDTLAQMEFYHLRPDRIRELQQPDAQPLLARDGANLASVMRYGRLPQDAKRRILEYLGRIAPDVVDVRSRTVEQMVTLRFHQRRARDDRVRQAPAMNVSDGTLRTLGILVALFQSWGGSVPLSLVGIEEPEATLHPAALGALLGALREASERVQVVVTSHSPDLLDSGDVETGSLLAVTADDGKTAIGPVDDVGRSILRDRLYTPGELLRLNQLTPDDASRAVAEQGAVDLCEVGRLVSAPDRDA